MIHISNAEYVALVTERDALKSKAVIFCDAVEAFLRASEDCVPESLRSVDETQLTNELYSLRSLAAN